MVTIEKTTPGNVRYRALGTSLTKGEQADVTDAEAEWLCDERGECERVDEDGGEENSDEGEDDDLTRLDGVGDATADGLREAGLETFDGIAEADAADVADEVEQLSEDDVVALQDQLAGNPAPVED